MGTCLSKKKGSSTTSPLAGRTKSATTAPAVSELKNSSRNGETEPELKLKKENKKVLEKHESAQEGGKGHVKKQIFIIKHRKSHDDRERNDEQNAPQSAANTEAIKGLVVGVRTSSCTKEEVDAILIQCGRLSRNSSGKAASSSPAAGRRYRSGSKRSFDLDHCHNDTISTEEDQKKTNASDELCEDDAEKRHRQSPRPLSQDSSSSSSRRRRRRRTPSREREQQHQRSSSRERRVSRSPGRRSSETTAPSNASSSRPGKMVSVPATVSSLVVVDKGESAAAATGNGIKRITVRRNVGAASPRSQSPARANANASNAQQQPSLSRNPSRKAAEQSPYRRNPLSEVDPNSLAFPHSATNDNSSRVVQNRPKKEFETEANNQKPNASRIALDKGVGVNCNCNCKTKVQQEGDVKVQSSMTHDDVVVKTVVPPGVDNLLLPQTLLTRSRSSRRSRDLDLNPEALLIPPQSYTSLLLEDIQNFHQKNTPPVSLPACVTKAYSILEAVADLNSNTSSNFSGEEGRRNRNEYNVPLGTTNNHGKRVPDTKDPVVESELVVNDDVLEPSLHKYVTVNSSRGGVDMEEQESSGSNSFTISSGKQHQGICSSSSWEPSSADSKDCWTSGLNNCREEGQKSPLGLEGRVSSEAGCDVDGAKKKLNSKRRGCDHQHVSGIGRGRLGANNVLHKKPVVTAAAST